MDNQRYKVNPIVGSCLCGGVRFEINQATGPAEICHCNRCRKMSGAGAITMISVRSENFILLQGAELVSTYSAPILYSEPAYQACFCKQCGSPVPLTGPHKEFMEIPIGLFDTDPGVRADKHIFVEFMPAWDNITDDLPQYSIADLIRERENKTLPDDFKLRSHYDNDGKDTT